MVSKNLTDAAAIHGNICGLRTQHGPLAVATLRTTSKVDDGTASEQRLGANRGSWASSWALLQREDA
jgi:hypothetical protein